MRHRYFSSKVLGLFGLVPFFASACVIVGGDSDTNTNTNDPDPPPNLCGNGVVDEDVGEACDDGNTDNTDDCPASCQPARCGDGYLHPASGEVCDLEGCDEACQVVQPILQVNGYCALLHDGRVKCWGANQWGALGYGDTIDRGDNKREMGEYLAYVDLGPAYHAVSLTDGTGFNCAILDNDQVKCWGANAHGQLGIGTAGFIGNKPGQMGTSLKVTSFGKDRHAVQLAAGKAHLCALLDDGSIKCCGWNEMGQSGHEDVNDWCDEPGEIGDKLPAVDLGTGKKAVAVTAGDYHTCALLDDGTVKCWGQNQDGELGLGDSNDRGNKPGTMGDALPPVNLGTGAKAVMVKSGGRTNCALLDDGSLKCWGYSQCDALGTGDGKSRGLSPGEMGDNLPAVDLGTDQEIVEMDIAHWTPCVRFADGTAKCWGCNDFGELGRSDPTEPWGMGELLPFVDVGTGKKIASISRSNVRSCALLDDGTVKCWGNNEVGQLGYGDTRNRGDEPGEMGDKLPIVHLYNMLW
jgi:alpha-tubulin suppressor-like RCC1 family protein